jgi:hypothetical protein
MKQQYSDEKNALLLNIFWLGILIYVVSYLIAQSDKVSYVLCNIFQITGMLLFIPTAVILIRFKFENKYLGITYILYLIWTLIIIVRGINFDYDSIKEQLFRPTLGLFLYLVPIVLLFPKGPVFFRKVFDVLLIAGIIYLVLCLAFIKELLVAYNEDTSQALTEYFSQHLSLPVGFLLLTFIYRSARINWIALFVMAVTFLLAVIRARRGLIFITFSMMFFSYLIYQYANKAKVVNIVLSAFVIIIISAAAARIYNENRKSTFSLITERIGQQTRTGVEQYFFMDLKSKDWIAGKGINGEYYCPGVREGVARISIFREVIDTGYLQVILNGGLISLVLMALIMIPAIVKGLFYSKNVLSKAAAIWIILFLLYAYPGTPTIFSINYFLVWISIGIAYSPEIRGIPEERLLIMLRNKDKITSQNQPCP